MPEVIPISSDLILQLDNGLGQSGRQLTKSRRYGQVKTGASDDDVYAVAQALSDLQTLPVIAIQRRNTVEIEASQP